MRTVLDANPAGLGVPKVSTWPAQVCSALEETTSGELRRGLQHEMTRGAGVLRSAASLQRATNGLRRFGRSADTLRVDDPSAWEVHNLLIVAQALIAAALEREESRGTHTRRDFPDRNDRFAGRFVHTGGHVTFVALPAPVRERHR
jgi:succinate dehydrogenase/fumarate reductase flavoprotein subunit